MKMKLLGGVALALILGVSSAAYANPKNTFSNGNTTAVYSTAVAVSTGHVNLGSGNGGSGGDGGDSKGGDGEKGWFNSGGKADDAGNGGKGGDGEVKNGNSTSYSSAVSESFNKNNEGVSSQTLVGISAVNVQIGAGYYYGSVKNEGATAKNIDTSGITSAAAASGNGALNVQGVSVGAGAEVSFD
jgi:hypothetical protein